MEITIGEVKELLDPQFVKFLRLVNKHEFCCIDIVILLTEALEEHYEFQDFINDLHDLSAELFSEEGKFYEE